MCGTSQPLESYPIDPGQLVRESRLRAGPCRVVAFDARVGVVHGLLVGVPLEPGAEDGGPGVVPHEGFVGGADAGAAVVLVGVVL